MTGVHIFGGLGPITDRLDKAEQVTLIQSAMPGLEAVLLFAYKKDKWMSDPYAKPAQEEGLMMYSIGDKRIEFLEETNSGKDISFEEKFRADARKIRSTVRSQTPIFLYSGQPIEGVLPTGQIFSLKSPNFTLEQLAERLRTSYCEPRKTEETTNA